MDYFSTLPEGCVSDILSLTSPPDACRSSAISKGFKSVADSDAVWDRFLPSDHQAIISRAESPVVFSTKKQLFSRLAHSHILIDGGKLSFALDKKSGKKCYMIGARMLTVIWGSSPQYWTWRFLEVANLRDVCWLDIRGKLETRFLSPKTAYVAYLVFKVAEQEYGLENLPAKAWVRVAGERAGDEDWDEDETTSSVYLKFRPRRRASRAAQNGVLPQGREDGWMEVELGEFFNDGGENGEVRMRLMETKRLNSKSGLIVEGIELRPKVYA
ncbi:F-box protein PP2-B10-like isoform X2 [Actinidia eriantha]|uniref:F-box protein PP2-B10-like isoform X2 n=1 Tax=Actinidia eriantha TaxID=165200 RepID=UPI002583D44D|nr:F-box protein PP2-B10-like isoform X2 [Actinidia eriantha]